MNSLKFIQYTLILMLVLLTANLVKAEIPAYPDVNFSYNYPMEKTKKFRNNYKRLKREIENKKDHFRQEYLEAQNQTQRNIVLIKARHYLLETAIEKLIPAWYGTTWNYYGHSDEPGKGTIACGYFVATVLKHLGFNVPRLRLGQQNSPSLIRNMANLETKKQSYELSIQQFMNRLKKYGPGLYIVGMDSHVGYVYFDGKKSAFIHSYGTVRSEDPTIPNALSVSKWRMFGKTFHHELIVNWVLDKQLNLDLRD